MSEAYHIGKKSRYFTTDDKQWRIEIYQDHEEGNEYHWELYAYKEGYMTGMPGVPPQLEDYSAITGSDFYGRGFDSIASCLEHMAKIVEKEIEEDDIHLEAPIEGLRDLIPKLQARYPIENNKRRNK